MLDIGFGVVIPQDELQFSTARASGPGGQHVNTTDSKVLLRFNISESRQLSPARKAQLLEALAHRLDSEGAVLITAQESRSQHVNKELALAKLAALLRKALTPRAPRRPTRPTLASKERRLAGKKLTAARKQARGRVPKADD
ncbi:putative Class I peptide chain release factor [Megalodesulfovibrio gigas DSM 1382 = ATCC 19364]|uniref:Putative Class I peptide chain release factor n=2 Tax=Megalodesulfovibrio gigas TaxID=879 RepID=T2G7V1_MEGG1|nr:putative Class I peptide chain release factor [Megalodesulfovibrio gigas DSM 1382 = ATCC 19364]